MKLRYISVFILLSPARAQSFSIPSSWQNTSMAYSYDERVRISQVALGQVATRWKPDDGLFDSVPGRTDLDALLYGALARGDRLAGTDKYSNMVANKVRDNANPSNESWLGVPVFWGITALDLYSARANDSEMLKIAQDQFDVVAQYQINQQDADTQKHPKKDGSFVSYCGTPDKSVAGGVFAVKDSNQMYISGTTTGYFVVLSSRLAEIEDLTGGKNTAYKEAAVLSAQFMLNNLMTKESLMVQQMELKSAKCQFGSTITASVNGATIEGFAVLADVTRDAKWSDTSTQILVAATRADSIVKSSGVLINGGDTLSSEDTNFAPTRGRFIRSLCEPLARLGSSNSALRDYINAFISIQYNTLQAHATTGDTGFYNSNWGGPAATEFNAHGTLDVVDILNAAIEPLVTPRDQKHDSLSKGAIIGLAVGASLLALLILLLIFLYIRRRRQKHLSASQTSNPFGGIIPPSMHATTTQVVSPANPGEVVLTYEPPRRRKGDILPIRYADAIPPLEQHHSLSPASNTDTRQSMSQVTASSPRENVESQSNQDLVRIVEGLLRDRGLGDAPPLYQNH